MTNNSNKCKPYVPIPTDWDAKGDPKLIDCCKTVTQDDSGGCDCCYDTLSNELKKKRNEYGTKSEEANQAKDSLNFEKNRRDGLKKWLDELTLLDEYSTEICQQFVLIISQVEKICSSSRHTVKAVEILFCMIRDFYSQLDKIKTNYDKLITCIKELDSSILVPDKGFYKCLISYNEKLEAVLSTKEDVVKQIMDIVKFANMVQQDVCADFGLACVLDKWRFKLGCGPADKEDGDSTEKEETVDLTKTPCEELDKKCILYPQIGFPIRSDTYYSWLNTEYTTSKSNVDTYADKYLEASKEKEAISAYINSLEAATQATNPKDRCK